MSENELRELMVGKDGKQYDTSLPAAQVSSRFVDEMRRKSLEIWPKEVHELVMATELPFVQVIKEYIPQGMNFGRVCLLGDAAHLAR